MSSEPQYHATPVLTRVSLICVVIGWLLLIALLAGHGSKRTSDAFLSCLTGSIVLGLLSLERLGTVYAALAALTLALRLGTAVMLGD